MGCLLNSVSNKGIFKSSSPSVFTLSRNLWGEVTNVPAFPGNLGASVSLLSFIKERGYYPCVIFIRNTVGTSSLETESALDVLCCDNEGKGVNKKIRGASISLEAFHLASASFYLIGWGTFSACENCQMSQIGSREARIWGHYRWQCFKPLFLPPIGASVS